MSAFRKRGMGAWSGLLILAVVPALAACQQAGPSGADSATDPAATADGAAYSTAASGDPERGRYLVTVTGCHDCHTPLQMGPQGPQPDMARQLSGHPQDLVMPEPPAAVGPWVWHGAGTNTAFAGPWGISYATNLTPDQNTGMGIWSEDMFVRAMRTGRHMGQSRQILPPMPWQNLAQATDEDLADIFAYLRSIPPLSNRVPEPVPPAEAPAPGDPPAG
ncbi:MAG TPA: diheme cytochrome c-553 [Thermoanaerobaculia bacterium]|nr:diheme cytochrome c-553 [Thermoanaerobaculia bacterium]